MKSPVEVAQLLASRIRDRRLERNLTQKSLADRAGVSLGTLKKFEHSGRISLESLLKIAVILDQLSEFAGLFKARAPESFSSLDELLKQEKKRQRGRA